MRASKWMAVCGLTALVPLAGLAVAEKTQATFITSDQMKFEELPNSNGVMSAPLWGEMNTGAYGSLSKFKPGWKEPLHTHTADMKAVVLKGTFVVTDAMGTEHRLTPGSYELIPAGVPHISACAPGAECMILQEQPGKFDLLLKPAQARTPAPQR